jgi:hypothetical protein
VGFKTGGTERTSKPISKKGQMTTKYPAWFSPPKDDGTTSHESENITPPSSKTHPWFETDASAIECRAAVLDTFAHDGKLGFSLTAAKKSIIVAADEMHDTGDSTNVAIGAFVSVIVPGGAADEAGAICVGDLIVEINGVLVREVEYKTIIEMLRAPGNPSLIVESSVYLNKEPTFSKASVDDADASPVLDGTVVANVVRTLFTSSEVDAESGNDADDSDADANTTACLEVAFDSEASDVAPAADDDYLLSLESKLDRSLLQQTCEDASCFLVNSLLRSEIQEFRDAAASAQARTQEIANQAHAKLRTNEMSKLALIGQVADAKEQIDDLKQKLAVEAIASTLREADDHHVGEMLEERRATVARAIAVVRAESEAEIAMIQDQCVLEKKAMLDASITAKALFANELEEVRTSGAHAIRTVTLSQAAIATVKREKGELKFENFSLKEEMQALERELSEMRVKTMLTKGELTSEREVLEQSLAKAQSQSVMRLAAVRAMHEREMADLQDAFDQRNALLQNEEIERRATEAAAAAATKQALQAVKTDVKVLKTALSGATAQIGRMTKQLGTENVTATFNHTEIGIELNKQRQRNESLAQKALAQKVGYSEHVEELKAMLGSIVEARDPESRAEMTSHVYEFALAFSEKEKVYAQDIAQFTE